MLISHRMDLGALRRFFLITGILVSSVAGQCVTQTSTGMPDAEAVMEKVIERSQEVARAGEAEKYRYERHSVEEELDAAGKATKTTEEVYDVIPIQGFPFERLVKVQ